jgi:glycosyltransferase involved in cell wall biosynthesis
VKHLVFFAEHLSHGGAERALIDFINNIDRRIYQVTLIVRDEKCDGSSLLDSVKADIPVHFVYPIKEDDSKLGLFRRLRKKHCPKADLKSRIHRLLSSFDRVDLLIDFSSVLAKISYSFSRYRKIYWIHGPKSHMGKAELLKFQLRIKNYDAIVVVSQGLKDELVQLIPSFKDKTYLVYNPFDVGRIVAAADDESELTPREREMIKLPYLLAVGRFAQEKDYETLLLAYARLNSAPPLYIVGDGSRRAQIESLVHKLHLEDRVFLLGQKNNPYIWMKNCLFFIHSAHIEGFGLVIVENMILGKAVLVSDCPFGPTEITDRGRYGMLFRPQDSVELSKRMAEIISSADLRRDLEGRSAQRANAFSTEQVFGAFYKVLDIAQS